MDESIVFVVCCLTLRCNILLTDGADYITTKLSEKGYRNEVHSVLTADRYILNVHRIPCTGRFSKPVILVHGMFSTGAQYIITGNGIPKSNSLAFRLADYGYDVWIVNARGTDFSLNHQTLSPDSPQYWKFSFHEIARYDLPAIIDHILLYTNHTFLHYVGHSQGTTVVMAMLSLLPEYNAKLKTLHLMSPAVYYDSASVLLKGISTLSTLLEDGTAVLRVDKLPSYVELRKIVAYLCSSISTTICKQMFNAFVGPSQYFDEAILRLPNSLDIIENVPAHAVSLGQLFHYAQLIRSAKFQHYDHKQEENLSIYNQSTPPVYKLSNVKTRIHFLYGTTDAVVNYQDVERLVKEFQPWTIRVDKIDNFNHLDFVAANKVNELVNTKILKLISRYRRN
ncbi:Lipase 1 [Pseudolycoriella hygida]|uniref:Lipase n=1 Tax=Pseudolycoriella hygida TaxID=35572 RepID=A0A9Q0RVW0_9DIPT|nr:Lipase 1 [Pseudolycoriella hygida]